MRAVRFAFVFMVLCASVAVGEASACFTCDPLLHCVGTSLGARFCLQTSISCSLLMPCAGGPSRDGDGLFRVAGDEDLTTFSLFDAAPGARVPAARRAGSVPLSIGEDMRAAAGVGAAPLAEAGVAYGRDFAGAFVDDSGTGFSLRRIVEGTRIRLEVRDMQGDHEGAVLASEFLDEGDQLTVPVRLDGRDRVLVLSTRTLPKALVRLDVSRLTRALAALGRTNAARTQPLFQLHAL